MLPKYLLDRIAKLEAIRRAKLPAVAPAFVDDPRITEAYCTEVFQLLAQYGQSISYDDLVSCGILTADQAAGVMDAIRQATAPTP